MHVVVGVGGRLSCRPCRERLGLACRPGGPCSTGQASIFGVEAAEEANQGNKATYLPTSSIKSPATDRTAAGSPPSIGSRQKGGADYARCRRSYSVPPLCKRETLLSRADGTIYEK